MSRPFHIVEFLESKEIDIIPSVWMTTINDKMKSYWPDYRNPHTVYQAAEAQVIPNKGKWKLYDIRSLHTFDTYSNTTSNINHFKNNSDFDGSEVDVQEDNIIPVPFKKSKFGRVLKSNVQVLSTGSDSDDDLQNMPLKYQLGPISLPSLPPEFGGAGALLTDLNTNAANLEALPGFSGQDLNSSPHRTSDFFIPTTPNSSQRVSATRARLLTSSEFSTVKAADSSKHNESEFQKMCLRNFSVIQTNQATIIEICDAILKKLIVSETLVESRLENPKIFLNLPFSKLDDFLGFDCNLESDEEMRKHVVIVLKLVGGKNATELTTNMLRKLLKDNIANLFTFTGANNKRTFSAMHVNALIFEAVTESKNGKNATETEVKKVTMSWLQHTGDRIKSAANTIKNRNNKEKVSSEEIEDE